MITGRQISAARGLLQWSVKDLAEKSGLTSPTLFKLESDAVQPQEQTISTIVNLFDRHGVEFTEDEGVRIRKQQTRTYTGKAGYRQLLDHIYETLKNGGRIRQFNFDDMRYLSYADDFVSEHIKRMSAIKGLDARVLQAEDNTEEQVSYCSYRTLEKGFHKIAPWYLYDDYMVLSLFEGSGKKEFVTIHSKLLASGYIDQFDIFWKMAATSKKRGTS